VNIVETIHETINRHSLIPEGNRLVVGVSGGADSIALLHALHHLSIPLTVAHLNHQLRGNESDADEQFVRNVASELNLPLVVKSVDVTQLKDRSGLSIEMAARQARHDFFSEFKSSTIALAHHADDQAETFILKLARGAGMDGLDGMSYSQNLNGLHIIRPMLGLPQADLIQWMEESNFEWREDASNQDMTFMRNRVRHTILPLLEKELNPNIRETILRTVDILREENVWMESLLEETNVNDVATWPLAARRRVLRKWLFENGSNGVDYDAVDQIINLQSHSSGTAYYELNKHQRVVIEYGNLRFESGSIQPERPHWTLHIEKGNGWKKDHGNGAGVLPAEASFDADKIGDSIIEVRSVLPGDRMRPMGMRGSRKLQDIFTDQKIPRTQRSSVPVVVCRDEIIWIPGYRTALDWEVKGSHGKSIHVRVERNRTT
jgi:tRNA(Ile)-lysidine synthase